MRERLRRVRKVYWLLLLVITTLFFWWFFFGQKGRVIGQMTGLPGGKIFGEEVNSSGEDKEVLGITEEAPQEKQKVVERATEKIIEQSKQKIIEQSSRFLETSIVTEPIREIQEVVRQRVNEIVETLKELPAKEIKNVKREVCKQWLEEDQ